MDFDNEIEWIEAYLDDQLSSDQQKEFERKRESDPDFEKVLQKEIIIRKGIMFSGMKEALDVIQEEEQKKIQGSNSASGKLWLGIAASLILVTSFVFFLLDTKPDTLVLFEDHFEPFPNVVTEQLRGNQSMAELNDAFEMYDSQKFAEAYRLFDNLGSSDVPFLNFYMANCKLALNQPDTAIILFNNYLLEDSTFRNESHWFLGLSYLKIREADKAVESFNKIDTAHSLRQKATIILKELQ